MDQIVVHCGSGTVGLYRMSEESEAAHLLTQAQAQATAERTDAEREKVQECRMLLALVAPLLSEHVGDAAMMQTAARKLEAGTVLAPAERIVFDRTLARLIAVLLG